MAKQPSKSARADSSAGQSAAAVSSNTDAVAAAEPATPKAPDAAADHAVADDNANIRDEARRRGVYAGCMCSWGLPSVDEADQPIDLSLQVASLLDCGLEDDWFGSSFIVPRPPGSCHNHLPTGVHTALDRPSTLDAAQSQPSAAPAPR